MRQIGVFSSWIASDGVSMSFCGYCRIRILGFNARKRQWQEDAVKEMANMYTVTGLTWRYDSLYLVSASLCGGVEMFESVAKRSLWNGCVEIVYVSSSQAVVKSVGGDAPAAFAPVVIRTQPGLEIESVILFTIFGSGSHNGANILLGLSTSRKRLIENRVENISN